ncbi:RpnC/YadD family protein [Gloeocapsopsis crepidinum]|uniref:hypothetical protein n=1 Tax=Gloeocapsopsis crepidinum TaxID=693223 RepID=UPI001D156B2B|nr:hypothetical protein [Gloeocapsopsis crepidinum]
MAYDNICKYLAQLYPQNFVRWLLSSQVSDIQVLKTELSLEPIRADSMTLLQTSNHILHLEFQTLQRKAEGRRQKAENINKNFSCGSKAH